MIIPFFSTKKSQTVPALLFTSFALAMLAISIDAGGMDAKPKSNSSDLDMGPVETPVPKSVFDVSKPYKDPFFPNSTRKRVQATAANVAVNTYDPSLYSLKGISGVPGQEVVIINNRNLAAGETGDVTLPSGTIVRITVVKIDGHSAVILPEGQRDPIIISLPKEDW